MQTSLLVEELVRVAEHLGIEIRFEEADTPGGVFTLKGRKTVLLGKNASNLEKIDVLTNALAEEKRLDEIYLLPEARRLVEEKRAKM